MNRLLVLCLLPFLLSVLLVPGSKAAAENTAPDPTAAPAGQIPRLTLNGEGVQIYECRQTGSVPAWTFVAPEARLQDASGAEVGSHGTGPSWKLKDGSKVRGKVIAQQPSGGTIPWLLLQAVEPQGPGALAAVTFIRRTETHGGAARTQGCDAANLGTMDRVPYTATYTFYGAAQ